MEGQLVDDDNQVAEMARRTAKALANGEKMLCRLSFAPSVNAAD
jgi:hypothetical protein